MTKDSIGNKLECGHFVQVQLPAGITALRGRVKSIDEGHIVKVGGAHKQDEQRPQPGTVIVEILLPCDSSPVNGIAPMLVRVWDPSGKDLQEQKTETAVV